MGFIITTAVIVLLYLSPEATIPWLAQYGFMPALIFLGLVVTSIGILGSRLSLMEPQIILLLVFCGWATVSPALHGWVGAVAPTFMKMIFPALSFLMVVANVTSIPRFRIFSGAMVMVSVYLAIRAVMAFHYGIERETYTIQQFTEQSEGMGEREFFYRACGPGFLGDPNDFAQHLTLSIALLGAIWKPRSPLRNLLLVVIPLAIMSYGLYITASRGALMGVFLLLALALKSRLGLGGPLVGGAVVFGLVVFLGFGGGRSISVASGSGGGRMAIWSDALSAFIAFPFRGVGFGAIRDYTYLTAHNTLLLCFTELGLIGYFFFVALFVLTLLQLQSVLRLVPAAVPANTEILRATKAIRNSIILFLATGLFLSRTYVITPYVLLGLGLAVFLTERSKEGSPVAAIKMPWVKYTLISMASSIILIYLAVRLHWL
ncbi:MAG: O-antigen ligase family protein [Bryobacterales bacterium]|nr:O-antigen ligase family protein [Bryobacterales bacterium]